MIHPPATTLVMGTWWKWIPYSQTPSWWEGVVTQPKTKEATDEYGKIVVEMQAFPFWVSNGRPIFGSKLLVQGVVTENYILLASSNSYFDRLALFDALDKFTILPSNETSTTWTTSKMVAWYHHLDIIHVRSSGIMTPTYDWHDIFFSKAWRWVRKTVTSWGARGPKTAS